MIRILAAIALVLAPLMASASNTNRAEWAKTLFGAKEAASSQPPGAIGGYARGCLAGAEQLAETGPTWQAMRLRRNRNWGHPKAIAFIKRLSEFAATQPGWKGLYIGDISQPRGGPMLTGHRSHQTGLDMDIWMKPAVNLRLSRATREKIPSTSMRRAEGAYVNRKWTQAHHAILREAARDPAVSRIFVFPGAKVRMCKDETGDRAWLQKIRPWWGHHYHFHVRLHCPKGAAGCIDQKLPPAGDGCADAEQWVHDILNPPPSDLDDPPEPLPEYLLTDLPDQCASVLSSN